MTTAVCRVYLCTYRRNELLPRALDSLLAQTFRDWICELHNDAPDDSFPRRLVADRGDPRIKVIDHHENLGPTRTFNLVYQPVAERYVAQLEDDNWWEPDFLETMIATMDAHPTVDLAWSNMRVWKEEMDRGWTDTGTCVRPPEDTKSARSFEFPNVTQIGGALHSHSAMIVRSRGIEQHRVPEGTSSAAVEPVRERTFRHPVLFVPTPLANFAQTRETSRPGDPTDWMTAQLLLVGSFFKNVAAFDSSLAEVWRSFRDRPARATNTLLLVGLFAPGCRRILRGASVGDAAYLCRAVIARPLRFVQLWRRVRRETELWRFLDQWTRERATATVEGQ